MKQVYSSTTLLLFDLYSYGQANTKLSNLVTPTALNTDLLPNNTNTRNFGSGILAWKNVYVTSGYHINGRLFMHNKGRYNTFVGDSAGTAVYQTGNLLDGSFNTG